jgi:hypothetical protein
MTVEVKTVDAIQNRVKAKLSQEALVRYEKLRQEVQRKRETLLIGERASDDLVSDYCRMVHNYIVGVYPGVVSYAKDFIFDSLDSDTRGAFDQSSGLTEFNRNVSDDLRRLFGKTVLTGDDLTKAKNAFRSVLHESGHALSALSKKDKVADWFFTDREVWAVNLEEALVEAFARNHVRAAAESLGLDIAHPGFLEAIIPLEKLPYKKQTQGMLDIFSWMEATCQIPAVDSLERFCLRISRRKFADALADDILRKHSLLAGYRSRGKISENARKRFRRVVSQIVKGKRGFDAPNNGVGVHLRLEEFVEEWADGNN